MTTTSLQQLSLAELEELLMEETKKFTSALHDGTSQEQKDVMRKRIDDIQQLLEKRKQGNANENTTPDLR